MCLARFFIFAVLSTITLSIVPELSAQNESNQAIRNVVTFEGVEREYFVQIPNEFDENKRYWLMVVVHGGGGNGRSFWLSKGIGIAMTDVGLDAIIVTPSFFNTDFQASRFPVLGEGAFLKLVLKHLRRELRLHKKILLTGYSRGGQFTHRFAMQHPNIVKACAPFSAGTWTTPDGKLLIQSLNEVEEPESFLGDQSNASLVPGRLKGMFEPRVAKIAGMPAKKGASKIPFLVMCGTLDPRIEISRQFANSLEANGFKVETQWPQTPHVGRTEYPEEFQKYSNSAVDFFIKVTGK